MLVRGTAPGPPTIKLNGLFGTFRVHGSNFRTNYVSTFANPAKNDGHAALVKELKPMRDRLDASQIKDLGSLLQRDLNDTRVARDLVPYLKGEGTSGIGFFPAILAVIVPKGYLADSAVDYPKPTSDPSKPNIVTFDNCWSVERYDAEGGGTLPLGMLELTPSRAEVIVLDGQHRASAFRYVAGDFDPGDDIYKMFYDGVEPEKNLDVDLPVTLIWFESDSGKPIDPKLISRRLFVDVNNTAKRISTSRTILLDDRAATCLATRAFYDGAAQNGFAPDKFSLLHGAFDIDSDLAESRLHKFVLTTPELINSSVYWGFFGSNGFDDLTFARVSSERAQRNKDKFTRIFPDFDDLRVSGDDDERYRRLFFEEPERAEEFRKAFASSYYQVLSLFFNQFSLLRPHYQACQEVDQWIMQTSGNSTQREVWRKVFCGGEGLYWSITRAQAEGDDLASQYKLAIAEIEQKFSQERATQYGQVRADVEDVYNSFVAKAFQTGYVTAVEYLARYETGGNYVDAADALINRLNDYSLEQWMAVFKDLRPLIVGTGLDPKSWPTYRNVLIRMYDGDKGQFFGWQNRTQSPDWIAYQAELKKAIAAYQNNDTSPDDIELQQRVDTILSETEATLQKCGLAASWFDHDQAATQGFDHARAEIDRLIG